MRLPVRRGVRERAAPRRRGVSVLSLVRPVRVFVSVHVTDQPGVADPAATRGANQPEETKTMTNDLTTGGPGETFSLTPRNLTEAMKYAEMISDSAVCPDAYKKKPGDILVAVQMGQEVGLKPMQSLQNIAVIKGKPSVYGDAGLAIVQASGLVESFDEDNQTTALKNSVGRCRMKRRGMPTVGEYTFSMEEATKAGITGNPCWKNNTGDMLVWRARWRCMRALFADVLKGLNSREEVEDMVHVTTTSEGVDVLMPRAKSDPAPREVASQTVEAERPKPTPAPATVGPASEAAYLVASVEQRTSAKGNPFWSADLIDANGQTVKASCFSKTKGPLLAGLVHKTAIVTIEEKTSGGKTYHNVTAVAEAAPVAQADDDDVKF